MATESAPRSMGPSAPISTACFPRATVVVLGHGSRTAAANHSFLAVVQRVAALSALADVRGAFLQLATPDLAEVLALPDLAERVLVVPTLLFAAGHLKRDLPALVDAARRRTQRAIVATGPLAASAAMVNLGVALARGVIQRIPQRCTLVVVGRGSSDREAILAFDRVAATIGRELGIPVEPAFVAATAPSVEIALSRVRTPGAVVLPLMVSAGQVVYAIEAACAAFRVGRPDVHIEVAPHLGGHEQFSAALAEHVLGELRARDWAAPSPR
ncbi:MAG: hypothetical protein B7733_03760 [Myxococcales bacterium FL481]|nr:MAG: hypothetical protein B7733_03760 [Myxococcales bacterium FL481]